jgi:hypothetical protein
MRASFNTCSFDEFTIALTDLLGKLGLKDAAHHDSAPFTASTRRVARRCGRTGSAHHEQRGAHGDYLRD